MKQKRDQKTKPRTQRVEKESYSKAKPNSQEKRRPESRGKPRPFSRGEDSKKTFKKESNRIQNPRRAYEESKTEGPKKNLAKEETIRPKARREFKPEKELFIWGKRTIESYLTNLHSQENILAAKHELHIIVDKASKAPAQLKPIVESAKVLGIAIKSHSSAEGAWPLSDSESLNHQRVCLKVPQYPVASMDDALKILKSSVENFEHGCLGLVLDQIQDPRNFGAILRSAAFFGVKFVIYATDRQSDISGLVLKTSAGGAFSLKLIPVVNINRALANLKEAGAWIIGTTLQPESKEFKELPKDRNWVLVLGNEEKGLRNEVGKNCDYLVKIPGSCAEVDSLNVSVAAGICIHALQN